MGPNKTERQNQAKSPTRFHEEAKNQWATAGTNLASRASGHPRTHRSTTATAMPALPKMDLQREAA